MYISYHVELLIKIIKTLNAIKEYKIFFYCVEFCVSKYY